MSVHVSRMSRGRKRELLGLHVRGNETVSVTKRGVEPHGGHVRVANGWIVVTPADGTPSDRRRVFIKDTQRLGVVVASGRARVVLGASERLARDVTVRATDAAVVLLPSGKVRRIVAFASDISQIAGPPAGGVLRVNEAALAATDLATIGGVRVKDSADASATSEAHVSVRAAGAADVAISGCVDIERDK